MIELFTQRVSSDFGLRKNPFTKFDEIHRGIDFVNDEINKAVYNVYKGIVYKSTFGDYGEGNYVQIVTKFDGMSLYCNYFHNEKNIAKEGDVVEVNQLIAIQGMTGTSTGIHTHFECFMYINKSNELYNNMVKNITNCVEKTRSFFHPIELYNYLIKYNYIKGVSA